MKPIIALTDFQIVLPKIEMDQKTSLGLTAQIHMAQPLGERVGILIERYGVKPTQIATRRFEDTELVTKGSDINELTHFFGKRAQEVFDKFYPTSAKAPNHIVHVTCTGYISPSPAQHLVNNHKWNRTNVTHAYHMGCYAALPAIRMAEGFVSAQNGQVDVVHTEMCGLHMDSKDHSPEQMVVQSLFADGHVKYSAIPQNIATNGFKVLNICEQIVPDSESDMSWIPASWGMKMTLSRDVPNKIGDCLKDFLERLVQDSGHSLPEVMKDAIFAIHPGGPKIIDSVGAKLELSNDQISASREVLLERGNMSSATLPHVWKKLLDRKIPSKKLVVSLAFGPGLTIFGALFETI